MELWTIEHGRDQIRPESSQGIRASLSRISQKVHLVRVGVQERSELSHRTTHTVQQQAPQERASSSRQVG